MFKSAKDTCAGCLKRADEGFHHPGYVDKQGKWTSDACTYEVETENYGELNFPGSKTKTANVEIYYYVLYSDKNKILIYSII